MALFPLFCSLSRLTKRFSCRRTFSSSATHLLARASFNTLSLGMDISIQSRLTRHYEHFQRLSDALARSALPLACFTTPSIRAQKLALRPASALVFGCGAGAFKLLPVSRLYFARPLAVSPAPLDTGSFSPRPTLRDTPFLAITTPSNY